MNAVFVTGTDTDVGKTYVSLHLIKALNTQGIETFGIKPIACGCNASLENEDALHLQATASIKKPYQTVNPFTFKDPIAPHLAAEKEGKRLSKSDIKKSILSSIQTNAGMNIIEGAGGWSVPLNESELFSEVITELSIPVILVVGIKLGCLNHALLTYKNILTMNAPFIGWIANCLASDAWMINENIQTLRQWIKHPCLGVVPYDSQTTAIIDIDTILHFNSVISPTAQA